MGDVIVVGAAIIHRERLMVAKRREPPAIAGYWELPGDEVRSDESEADALQREFASEFNLSVECVDRILGEQRLTWWREEDGETTDANLRIWRCRFQTGRIVDIDAGEPQPNRAKYDDVSWVSLDDVDAVGPWRDADRMMLSALTDYYRGDLNWRSWT